MKTGTTTHYALCRFKNRPDAKCRKPARCRVCGRVLFFAFADRLCAGCADAAHRLGSDKAATGVAAAFSGKAVQA